jgi:hypothetical protein
MNWNRNIYDKLTIAFLDVRSEVRKNASAEFSSRVSKQRRSAPFQGGNFPLSKIA